MTRSVIQDDIKRVITMGQHVSKTVIIHIPGCQSLSLFLSTEIGNQVHVTVKITTRFIPENGKIITNGLTTCNNIAQAVEVKIVYAGRSTTHCSNILGECKIS